MCGAGNLKRFAAFSEENMGAARYIWIDDSLRPASEGVVPFRERRRAIRLQRVRRHPLLRDRQRTGRVPAWTNTCERLLDSAHIVGFRELPVTAEQVKTAINQTIAANEFSACYIRPMIYLDGAMSLTVEAGQPRFVVAVWEWKNFLGAEAKERGIRANIASFTRLHPNIMMTKAKVSGNYVSSILAKTESQRAGFDEAIMLGPDGYVAECTGENLFIVRNKNDLHHAARRNSGRHHPRQPDHAGSRLGLLRGRGADLPRSALYCRRSVCVRHGGGSRGVARNRFPHHRRRQGRSSNARPATGVRQTGKRQARALGDGWRRCRR